MRVLFEVVHPADVLFFKRPLDRLAARGDSFFIASRHKDVTCTLLDEFGYSHEPLTRAGAGLIGLGAEMIRRDFALFCVARRFRPDVMVGFGGVAISHVGRVLRIPSIAFYDSENARLQTSLTWPFITHLFVPDAYTGRTPTNRTTRLPGNPKLAYLHPAVFKPDRALAIENGLDPDVDNFFIRLVSWGANHDIGKSGWAPATLRSVIARLSRVGKVHISSETTANEELSPLVYSGAPSAIHHVLGHCRLYVGESATMASEAANLCVPAIYCGRDFPGYVQELGRAGLVDVVSVDALDKLLELIERRCDVSLPEYRNLHERYYRKCPDWADAVVDAIDRHQPVPAS